MANMSRSRRVRLTMPAPPPLQIEVIIHGDRIQLEPWLVHYWQKLQLPPAELSLLALTQDRQEYMRWTGKRLNVMALGCYCYIPAPRVILKSSGAKTEDKLPSHRHLIFIEPTMQAGSIEVTVAHELIHLSDRVQGNPRRHHHHGYDSIALDEAAITGYAVEDLRKLLQEESIQRENIRRERRPIRYIYQCPHCRKLYPRTRRYSRAVSCSDCDKHYNPQFALQLMPAVPVEGEALP
jgi:predicted SprT family Zn-dependent metalloprotease